MPTIFTFKRTEKKYLMSEAVYEALRSALVPYMKVDKYGLHTICNIYYDTQCYDLIRTSIEKPVYKEKLRLRSYGIPSEQSDVFIEIKKKYNGIVYKRRIMLPLHQASDYLEHGAYPPDDSQILHEIDYFIKFYQPTAKLFLAYDRIAMYGIDDPDFRITFDRNIRSRSERLRLSAGDDGELLFADAPRYLMEVKITGAMPLWLSHILAQLELYPVSFSKYGAVYTSKILTQNKGESQYVI